MPVDSADDLYGLPLDRFIPERAALTKRLRGEKRRDEASAVAARRKPSVAAWAVNQLVRTQAKRMNALFRAGDDLAQAQAGAASGTRAADAMREAMRHQREALDELLEAARGLLTSDGHPLTPATLDRVTDTLRAASIDEDSRRQVADGCLTQELAFAGLGIGELSASAPASPPRGTAKSRQGARTKAEPAAEPKAKPEAERKAKRAAEQKAALKAARQAESKARRAATRAEHELATAEGKRESAAEALEEAERLLATARDRAQSTAAELTEAERAVRRLAGKP